MHTSVHKSSVPDAYTLLIIKAYLNVSVLVPVMYVCVCQLCMYVCMHVCTKSFLKTQQSPRVFVHTWRMKLILVLILKLRSKVLIVLFAYNLILHLGALIVNKRKWLARL